MATQDTNTTALYLSVAESVWGETPASTTMVQWPYRTCGLKPNKKTVMSEHIRSDRMRDDLAFVGEDVSGSVAWELQPINVGGTNYIAKILEGTLCGAFGAQASTSSVTATVSTNKYAASGIHTGRAVGDWVTAKSFANNANNGIARITVVGTDEITVDKTLANDSGGTIYSRKLANGVTKKSYLTEQQFTDITQFAYDNGLRFESLAFEVVAEQIITCTATLSGKTESLSGSSVGGARTAANVKGVMTASVNVGTILIDGSSIGVGVKRASFTLKNNLRTQSQVGSRSPRGVGLGYFDVEGTLEVYFEDETLYNHSRNHDDVALVIPITSTEAYGDGFAFEFPRVKFGDPTKEIQGGNNDLTLVLPFSGLRHAAKNASCIVHAMGETA